MSKEMIGPAPRQVSPAFLIKMEHSLSDELMGDLHGASNRQVDRAASERTFEPLSFVNFWEWDLGGGGPFCFLLTERHDSILPLWTSFVIL